MLSSLQTRLGSWVTWTLVAVALLSLFGGGIGSVALFFLWSVTKDGGGSGMAHQPSDNGHEADMNGALSEDESATG